MRPDVDGFVPTNIKVGWRTYRVEVWDPEVAQARQMYGECDHIAQTIRIDTQHDPVQVAETLWHECLHAAYDVGILNRREESEEELVVSFMSSWTMTMLIDNPALLEFIRRALTGDWSR